MELGKQHQQGPQNSYPISARGLEGFNIGRVGFGFLLDAELVVGVEIKCGFQGAAFCCGLGRGSAAFLLGFG